MQDDDLFAKYPPDNEQWLDQLGQVGEVLDQLLDPRLELHLPDHSDLKAGCVKYRAGRSRWQSPLTATACDGSAASAASDCVTSSHAPDDKAPPASSAQCRVHRYGR